MGEKYTTVPVRVSYLNIWVPKSVKNSKPKYSATLLFDKKNKEQMADLKRIIAILEKIKEEKWEESKRPKLPVYGKDLSFIKDVDSAQDKNGEALVDKNPEHAGHFTINLYSKDPLQFIVDRRRQPLSDRRIIYSGCYCRVRMELYAYDKDNSKGVTGSLIGLQFWGEGEPLGGFVPDRLEDAFEQADELEDDPPPF